jgi:hypothetical protein
MWDDQQSLMVLLRICRVQAVNMSADRRSSANVNENAEPGATHDLDSWRQILGYLEPLALGCGCVFLHHRMPATAAWTT